MPEMKQANLYIRTDQHKALIALSAHTERSLASLVREGIDIIIAHHLEADPGCRVAMDAVFSPEDFAQLEELAKEAWPR